MDFLHRARHPEPQPGFGGAQIALVGVAQGVGVGRVPGKAAGRGDHDRPVGRAIDGPAAWLGLALDGNLDRYRLDRMGRAIDQIGHGVARLQIQLEEREVAVGGDRVGPGHVLVEADGDPGQAGHGHAHDIQLPRQGQVDLVEPVGGRPGKVRIGQDEAAALGCEVLAEGPAIAAQSGILRRLGRPQGQLRRAARRTGRHDP